MSFKDLEESVVGLTMNLMGEPITYTPNGGSPLTINGIFKSDWVDLQGIMTLKPTVRINLADLQSPPDKADAVSIGSDNYKIIESRPDGFGGSTLILQKA